MSSIAMTQQLNQPPVPNAVETIEDRNEWVLSAPFRAHVIHLMETAQIPWPVVAFQAGVPLYTVRTLIFGRAGKIRPKIALEAARNLIGLHMEDLNWTRYAYISAENTAMRVRCLRSLGIPWQHISHNLTLDLETCQAIARGERTSCSVMVDILAQCACAQVGLQSWEDLNDTEEE